MGAVLGACTSCFGMGVLGAKRIEYILIFLCVPIILGWVLRGFFLNLACGSYWITIQGLSLGGFQVTVPIYLAEIAKTHEIIQIRGSLICMCHLMRCIGILVSLSIGTSGKSLGNGWIIVIFVFLTSLPIIGLLLLVKSRYSMSKPRRLSRTEQNMLSNEVSCAMNWFRSG